MSYILDALRRADAERERGTVPGLHAKPLTMDALPEAAPERRLPWLPIAVGSGVAVVAVAGLAWWLRPAAVVPPAVPPAVIAAAPAIAQPAPAPLPAPSPAPVIAMAPPLQPPVVAPAAVPPPAAAPARATKPAVVKTEKAEKAEKAPKPENPPAKPAAAAAPPTTPFAQLPPDVRSQLPPITLGGSIYSDSPASRFVMINGQVVREGEPAATGVVLERIGPKSAILRWREWRIEVPL